MLTSGGLEFEKSCNFPRLCDHFHTLLFCYVSFPPPFFFILSIGEEINIPSSAGVALVNGLRERETARKEARRRRRRKTIPNMRTGIFFLLPQGERKRERERETEYPHSPPEI